MARHAPRSSVRHLAGLVVAAGLGAACYGLSQYLPVWVRGTVLQNFGHLVTLGAVIAFLSLAEIGWTFLTERLARRP